MSRGTTRLTASHTGWRAAWPFLLPALLLYVGLIVYPAGDVLALSFFRWDGAAPERVFVGFENYRKIFLHDPIFWRACANSGIWAALSLMVPTVLGLGLAVALDRAIPGRALLRTIFYLPAVFAPIAVAAIWSWLYQPSFGLAGALFARAGFIAPDWLGNRDLALYSVFVASAWAGTGPNMLLFLAGLQNVPRELQEAARVDGAGWLQTFRHVTLPALRSTFVVVLCLSLINSLKAFDLVYGMTAGGPGDASQVLASWSYTQAFSYRNFGAGAAVAVVLLGLTLVIVVPYVRWFGREE